MKKTILLLYAIMYQRNKNITYSEKLSISVVTIGVLMLVMAFLIVNPLFSLNS